jgi:hypothetical protein
MPEQTASIARVRTSFGIERGIVEG